MTTLKYADMSRAEKSVFNALKKLGEISASNVVAAWALEMLAVKKTIATTIKALMAAEFDEDAVLERMQPGDPCSREPG